MGQEITSTNFTDRDFAEFELHLNKETEQLRQLFRQNAFNDGPKVGGFELEAWLTNKQALPVADNVTFLKTLNHPEVVPELSLFNIEINVQPLVLSDDTLNRFHSNLQNNWQECRKVANESANEVMAIGIHPLIKEKDLILANMSKSQRYNALNEQILLMRNKIPINIDIHGHEHLELSHYDVMLEAATTSFQVHVQINQSQAVRAYNAAQIISAPLIAISANSPFLFGYDLYDESRIPLFEQSIDLGESHKQRVRFGNQYIENSFFNLFKNNLELYPVLIPDNHINDTHGFTHLRLHNGTIWRWNRPLLGFNHDGSAHLRIENRVIPAGPTTVDMIANAAFYWGVLESFLNMKTPAEDKLAFNHVHDNFYNAAKNSLDATFVWFDEKTITSRALILNNLLPMAEEGLQSLGIRAKDISFYLDIIKSRVLCGQNGAMWQRQYIAKHGRNLQEMACTYLQNQQSEVPVHEWSI